MSSRPGELRFLDPAVLARLGTLDLKARTIVEGFLAGLHRSPMKGFSVEFAEYRQYMPGDDLASIDWKVYARSDRYYVKKYEQETNLDCYLLVDTSASMGYGSRGVTKLEYASMLAASLAYLMHRQRDAVGLTVFDESIVSMLPPGTRPGHLQSLVAALAGVKLGSRTNLSKPLHQLAEGIPKRGMVVLISDLLDDADPVIDGLRHLRFRGTDVIVLHVMDPDELSFPFQRAARFRDPEQGDEIIADPAAVRDEYLKALRSHLGRYDHEIRAAGIDYRLLSTAEPLELALSAYLGTRSRLH